MQRKYVNWLSWGLVFTMLCAILFPNVDPAQAASAVGSGGAIPAGGTPGPDGGVNMNAAFRVGLVNEQLKDSNKFVVNMTNAQAINKIKDNYKNHFPTMENSIIFAPAANYTTNMNLAWYSASSGDMQLIDFKNTPEGKAYKAAKFRKIDSPVDRNSIFYDKLEDAAPFIENADTAGQAAAAKACASYDSYMDCKIGNGKWKNVVNWNSGCSSSCASFAAPQWSYWLSHLNEINTKIKEFIREADSDGDERKKYEARLHYLDLLITLWVLAPSGDDKDYYSSEIDRYIAGKGLDTKPVLIAIDTVSRFYADNYSDKYLFIPSIDFVLWAHGATPKGDLRLASFNANPGGDPHRPKNDANGDTKDLITTSANISISELPNRKRTTEASIKGNAFAYGYNGVTGWSFRTTSGWGIWGDRGSVDSGIMESLVFNGNQYGFMIIGGALNKPVIECECTQKVSLKMDGAAAPSTYEVTDNKVGKKIDMLIETKQTDEAVQDWKDALSTASNVKLQIRLWRSWRQGGDGSSANWKALSGNLAPPATDQVPNAYVTISGYNAIIDMFKGKTPIIFSDDLSNYAMPADSSMTLAYNATIRIEWTDRDGKVQKKECNSTLTKSPEITFWKGPVPVPRKGYYTSVPSFWSEIKQGSPSTSGTGSNEQFDAMAGTPTNRSLYFASGGSEFIVDIETEYVSSATATRTYTSKFNKVKSGKWIDPDTGPVSHDGAPSCNAPRSATDISGSTFTETVSVSSSEHITQQKKAPSYDSEGNMTDPGQPKISHTDSWCVYSGGHTIMVGGYSDTWTQSSTFDYMKINKAKVWKLDQSKVDGMTRLIGTDTVTATVVQGDPTMFVNIASANTSAAGRLRYSLEPDQHDNVVWNEGDSDNRDSNSKSDSYVNEQQQFEKRRESLTNVTAVSDFLILQTSTGDQSVMYFEKTSPTVKTTDPLVVPTTSKETMWDNNSNSAAKWTPQQIHIGSYNGQYQNPNGKYSGSGGSNVSTVFDRLPAGMSRPARPSGPMRLMATGLNPILTNPNGLYMTGTSTVFYKNILNHRPSSPTPYSTAVDSLYGASGQSYLSTYSSSHSKVNDVVLHDPVSASGAIVIPLPDSMDQRTASTKAVGGNLQQPIVQYDKVLDPDYRQNIMFNGGAEYANDDGSVAGWNTWTSTPGANVKFTSRAGDSWVMSGTRSFEINTKENTSGPSSGTNYIGVYWKDIDIKPNIQYKFTGKMSCHRCEGYFYIDLYNSDGSVHQSGVVSPQGSVINTGTVASRTITFTSGPNVSKARIHIVKGNSNGSVSGSRDYVFADDLTLQNMTFQDFVPLDPIYATKTIPNPDYVPYVPPTSQDFAYTGNVQTFTASHSGTYTLEVWGAQGGNYGNQAGGLGGYSKGDITLAAGQTISVYVGGSSGYNGGGSGSTASGGGGTDVRIGGTSLNNRVIVAGGGGGAGSLSSGIGGYGGGTTGGSGGGRWNASGGTQSSGGTSSGGSYGALGQGGSSEGCGGAGGGGGGYYGGGGGATDYPNYCDNDDDGGGGGSGYVGGVTNASIIAGNASMPNPVGGNETGHSGNGYARITMPGSGTGGRVLTYNYTGGVQSYTATVNGAYKLEAWGAQGGNDTAGTPGGLGGYASGTINLTAGQTLNIYVGGQGGTSNYNSGTGSSAGWNGGGAGGYGSGGGGATDARIGSSKIIVAGGGGGAAGWNSTSYAGGTGGGATGGTGIGNGSYTPAYGGSQTAGGAGGNWSNTESGSLGKGGDSVSGSGGGGGGGGYYGGGAGVLSGGGGGSGYIGGVTQGTMSNGTRTGNGLFIITEPPAPSEPQYITTTEMVDPGEQSIPESAYKLVEKPFNPNAEVNVPGLGSFTPGNFISLDYKFQVSFPNRGDFFGNGAWGIAYPSATEGKGFIDNMDTTEWTKSKAVKFDFNVIYNNEMYAAGTWIELPVSQTMFEFYCPLANREAISALVQFRAIAINGQAVDNQLPNNKSRDDSYAAKHSGIKSNNIDVVGRIGNMVIEDTSDFRFSNLFKRPVSPTEWFVPNVVKRVNPQSQNRIVGDSRDILNNTVNAATNYLDTYGLLPHLRQQPVSLPLSYERNNIPALMKQPLRLGYHVFSDFQTIGDYYNSVQIIPYYYALNLKDGSITPVDIFMSVDGEYQPINKFGAAVPGWEPNTIYQYVYSLDWSGEKGRRNVSAQEDLTTNSVIQYFKSDDDNLPTSSMDQPYGERYPFGTAQIMYLKGRNRTFIGTSNTYGVNHNPGGALDNHMFQLQAQRWHFTYGLPSSAVIVPHGQQPTKSNIELLMNNNNVLLMAADIKSIGDTYALQYAIPGGGENLPVGGWPTSEIPWPVLAVMSASKTSADDLEVRGTH